MPPFTEQCTVPPISGAITAQSTLSPAQNTKGKVVDISPPKITDMPGAMRGMGWEDAARMLDKWLNGEACRLEGELLEQYNDDPMSIPPDQCDETTVTMDWALGYARVREAYDKLLAGWQIPGAINALKDKLEEQFWPQTFGNTGYSARELHAHCQVQFGPFGGLLDTIDEMYGIIGKAALYLAVVGYFTPGFPVRVSGNIVGDSTFTVTDIGIYLRDIYEFNGSQFLGVWTKTRTYGKAEVISTILGAGPAAVQNIQYITEPFSFVFNSDFRAYQKKYGKGRDFFIFSDVKWEKPKNGPIVIPIYSSSYLEIPSRPVIIV